MDSPKLAQGSNWFGREQKSRPGGGFTLIVAENSETSEVLGTFGVPLELCPTSSVNEVET